MKKHGFKSQENQFFYSFVAVQALLRPPSVTPELSLFPFSVNEHSGLARQTMGFLTN